MLTVILSSLVVIMTYLFWYRPNKQYADVINRLPGPKTRPIVGNMVRLKDTHQWFKRMIGFSDQFREHGLFRFWLFGRPIVFIFNYKFQEVILSSSKYIQKSPSYKDLEPWLGLGLLTSNGDKWFKRRKMLTPTFHFKILNDFIHIFNKEAMNLVDRLEAKVGQGSFNIMSMFQLCTLDVICETAMGTKIEAQKKSESVYVKAVGRISHLLIRRLRNPFFARSDLLYRLFGDGKEYEANLKTVHDFTKTVIANRLKKFEENKNNGDIDKKNDELFSGKTRMAFLDMLIHISENLTKLSLDDIQEEVDTFMFEGHDTTASGLTFSAYLIASHPDVQAKVQKELDQVLGSDQRDITTEDLREMKYLECCIKEAMRIFPPVPTYGREMCEDVTINGYTIPKGSMINLHSFMLHRDPDVFPNPEKFDPDRFLLENSKDRNPYSYVPFSAGPRNCIGQKFALMEEKIVLAHLFRRLNLRATQTREELRLVMELVLKPTVGCFMEVQSR